MLMLVTTFMASPTVATTALASGRARAVKPTITLTVIAEAGIDLKLTSLANKELAEILGSAGIRLIWHLCGTDSRDAFADTRCPGPQEVPDFLFRISYGKPPDRSQNMLACAMFDEALEEPSAMVYFPGIV